METGFTEAYQNMEQGHPDPLLDSPSNSTPYNSTPFSMNNGKFFFTSLC